MKRFLLAGTGVLLSVAASAQSTNVVREVKTDLPAKNTVLASNTGAITTPTVPTIPTPEAQKLLTRPNTVLLDVRTPAEYAAGHLKGAQNLDVRAADFTEQLARLDPGKTYVLYCRSGGRSNQAGILMQEKGFQHVVNAGAYEELKKQDVRK